MFPPDPPLYSSPETFSVWVMKTVNRKNRLIWTLMWLFRQCRLPIVLQKFFEGFLVYVLYFWACSLFWYLSALAFFLWCLRMEGVHCRFAKPTPNNKDCSSDTQLTLRGGQKSLSWLLKAWNSHLFCLKDTWQIWYCLIVNLNFFPFKMTKKWTLSFRPARYFWM